MYINRDKISEGREENNNKLKLEINNLKFLNCGRTRRNVGCYFM